SSQFVLGRLTRGYHFCKTGHLRDKLFDFTLAIECIATPRSRKIAPFDEVDPRRAKAVERTPLLARPQRGYAAQNSAKSWRHVSKRTLNPRIKCTGVYGCRLDFIQLLKTGRNASLDGTLSQDLRTK